MAKRTNIIRIIKDEIKKGNNYVAPNGNFVSADMLNREIIDIYKRDLTSGSIDFSVSLEQYKKDKLSQYTTAAEVLDGICEAFHLVNDETSTAEAADGGEAGEVMPEPHSETSEPSPETSEPTKPKRGKSKAGDEK